jgi:hypothetical protein
MLVAEKNRYQSPRSQTIKNDIKTYIDFLKNEAAVIANEIEKQIEGDVPLKEKYSKPFRE